METVIVLDFGGQYNQMIVRRVRELNVHAELLPFNTSYEKIKQISPIGIIFSGGPNSVYLENCPDIDHRIYQLNIPILAICYGCQIMAKTFGGLVKQGAREYGKQTISLNGGILFDGLKQSVNLMSHTDYIDICPKDFVVTAHTENCPVAAIENAEKRLFGVQFHPEVIYETEKSQIIQNFLFKICKAKGDWTMAEFTKNSIKHLREKIGDKKVLCALSGGVDSAVAAALIHKACPNLLCVFVDHGMLRKFEADEVMKVFKHQMGMNVIKIDASQRFLSRLKGIDDPEQKRKIIGEEFIRVFEDEAKKIGTVDYFVQGTIYSDVIESGTKSSAKIKSHHNVGGLPSVIDFKEIIEPLRDLFKDEVRKCGLELGLSEQLVMRQPFPGPGLAVRILGEITLDKIECLQDADHIFTQEIYNSGLSGSIWQYFAVLLPIKSVGVMGDYRTYSNAIALRAVNSVDAMTAEWAKIPFDVLERASAKIVNNVKNINRVVYDITSKPPATIEWE